MKSLTIINTCLLFLALTYLFACDDSAEKTFSKKNTVNVAGSKKETPDKGGNISMAVKKDGTRWYADASKSQITFNVNGPFGKVDGSLSGLKSTLIFDKNDLASSSISASVDPKTIKTGIRLRDKDLQKEKFLNSDNYSFISFRSEKIQKNGNGYLAVGGLTLKGTTRRVEIPFSFSEKGNSGVFKASFDIQRQDFKVGKPGGSIGNTIHINLDVPVTK
jgi:polyisoprenoid-binding protein YceI